VRLKEEKMEEARLTNRKLEAIAWGVLLILLGVDFFVPGWFVPYGIGMAGIGLILLGLNLARSLSHVPVRGFSIALGVLALIEGGAALARGLLDIPVKLPFFPVVLIGGGVILIYRVIVPKKHNPVSPQS
jgi:hypothetical protein